MVLCNFSVTRIVYRSYHNMQQLTMSCLENAKNLNRFQQPIKLRHQISAVSSSSSTTSKSISLITQDEIRFINMCNLLTASFVLCWGCQMVSEGLGQGLGNGKFVQWEQLWATTLGLWSDVAFYNLIAVNGTIAEFREIKILIVS